MAEGPWSSGKLPAGRWSCQAEQGGGDGAHKDVPMYAETCNICMILATLMHTTRMGSSEMYYDLCNFCANSVASVHRVNPHWEVV